MPNGNIPVTWDQFQKHLDEAVEGFERLGSLEAEIKGDPLTGRLSLRGEVKREIQNVVAEFTLEQKKTRRAIVTSVSITILTLIAKAIIDWTIFDRMSL